MTTTQKYTKTLTLINEGMSALAACKKTGLNYSTYQNRKRVNAKAKRTITNTTETTEYPITLSGRTQFGTITITTTVKNLERVLRNF